MNEALETALNPSLGDLVDDQSFGEVCTSYFRLFEVPIRVFDAKSNLVSEAARPYPICKQFGESEDARRICIATRMKVKSTLPEDKRLTSIDCLCGLRYTAAPIRFQGSVLGKIVFGPFRPAKNEREPGRIYDRDSAIDLNATNETLAAMRQTSGTVIRKVAMAMLSVLDAVLFSAHKALVTSQMHLASVQESYRELAKKNQELEEMHEQMKTFERIKSSFLSTVSHELRTPLTSIIGYSDMLFEGIAGSLDSEQRQFIDTIRSKGEELLKLISALLDFSQIESGHLSLRKHATEPKALIEGVLAGIAVNAERRGVQLATVFADDLRPVLLDSERIETAVRHLLDNAIKFSSPGGTVKVSAQMTASEACADDEDEGMGFVLMTSPDWLEIAIEDYGEGIAEQDHERIFVPFTQLDDSTTREHGGAGLGLAVVKQFVEAHGGKVRLVSTPAEGSRFTIRLPIMPM